MARTVVAAALALGLWWGLDRPAEAARRRPIRCCIMVPADGGGERPYCFGLRVRPARAARRVCRAVGGTPARAAR